MKLNSRQFNKQKSIPEPPFLAKDHNWCALDSLTLFIRNRIQNTFKTIYISNSYNTSQKFSLFLQPPKKPQSRIVRIRNYQKYPSVLILPRTPNKFFFVQKNHAMQPLIRVWFFADSWSTFRKQSGKDWT